ncbi:hypothetical protein TRFO_14739 [Tritrichomonas foetus]|uniref:Uncharacterized protein n=1 Tax=Tritrichomonas foetus TaxID=1144522 RepID=A0A1J4KYN7_9EUKA|nr:hypothetical protein TRFO_14739 [Tritrichomonas foetus]|eukprot:OHT14812.1 hypothetical protein TRFO_14739 [Tritrichomonas foetus]
MEIFFFIEPVTKNNLHQRMKTMSLDGLKSYLDEHQIECKSPHSIFSSNSKIYNQMYEEMSDIDNFSPIPSVYDFNSYDEYQIQLDEWKKQMQYFIKETCLPVPLIHAIPRPMRPSTDKSRPKFNEPPRLTPRNFAVIVDIISNNKVIDLNMILPEKKLKDDLTLGVFMNDYYPWSSTLIPQRPSPSLYDSFIEYEVAMINWGDIVMKSELRETEIELKMKNEENEEKYKTEFNYDSDLPPGPAFIGQKAKLVAVSSSSNVPPPPPSEIINDQIPFVDLDFHENKFRDKLKKLKKCYQKFSSSPFILFSSIPNETSIMPPNTHYKNTFSVISILCMYGTPLSIQNNSLTNIFREEKTLFDIGSMTKGEHIIKGPNDKEYTYDEFFLILENDPIKLLLIDLSPIQFKELIQIPVPGNFPPKTV